MYRLNGTGIFVIQLFKPTPLAYLVLLWDITLFAYLNILTDPYSPRQLQGLVWRLWSQEQSYKITVHNMRAGQGDAGT